MFVSSFCVSMCSLIANLIHLLQQTNKVQKQFSSYINDEWSEDVKNHFFYFGKLLILENFYFYPKNNENIYRFLEKMHGLWHPTQICLWKHFEWNNFFSHENRYFLLNKIRIKSISFECYKTNLSLRHAQLLLNIVFLFFKLTRKKYCDLSKRVRLDHLCLSFYWII